MTKTPRDLVDDLVNAAVEYQSECCSGMSGEIGQAYLASAQQELKVCQERVEKFVVQALQIRSLCKDMLEFVDSFAEYPGLVAQEARDLTKRASRLLAGTELNVSLDDGTEAKKILRELVTALRATSIGNAVSGRVVEAMKEADALLDNKEHTSGET